MVSKRVFPVLTVISVLLVAMLGCYPDSSTSGKGKKPYFKSKARGNATELVTYIYKIAVGDKNGVEKLRITRSRQDTCLGEVVDNGNRTGKYIFAPSQRTAGTTCVVGVKVTDSNGNSTKQKRVVNIASRSIDPGDIPGAGFAAAQPITDPKMGLWGLDALGGAGDYILMNDRAAFIISGLTTIDNSYNYYGGLLIDAVALEGGAQAGPEQFEEFFIAVGQTNPDLSLRSFRGEQIEILNDGADGNAAIIRVYGVDDPFWLIELELIPMMGLPRSLSYGLTLYVDYILEPDSSVLQMDINAYNPQAVPVELLVGAAVFIGDTTDLEHPYSQYLAMFGITAAIDIPWLVASSYDGDGALGIQMLDAEMASVNISGVQAILDVATLAAPTPIASGGLNTVTFLVSVGGTDANSALDPIYAANPSPLPGLTFTVNNISGNVTDATSGNPIQNAEIEVQVSFNGGDYAMMDSYRTDALGDFSGTIPGFAHASDTFQYQLAGNADGYQDLVPTPLDPTSATGLNVEFQPDGILSYDVHDSFGMNLPCKIQLWRTSDGGLEHSIHSTTGVGLQTVDPGDYNISVVRGFEYTTYWDPATITQGVVTNLDVTIDRVVDTTGYMSTDTHMHSGPSADNTISIPERIRTVVADGLEIPISTDHEYISDWWPAIRETGTGDWCATVAGQEVTASIPGHSNIYGGILPKYHLDARGDIVDWWLPNGDDRAYYSMDVEQIFAAERARGAQIVQINHPRSGMAGFSNYNPLTGEPEGNPLDVGLSPDAQMLTWDSDFDVYELMNDPNDIFGNTFEDWMSFLNFGHPVTAVGVSDIHNYGYPGYPRSYFESSTDDPREFMEAELVESILEGSILLGSGAFARVEVTENGVSGGMGDVVTVTDGDIDLWVHIEGIPEIDVAYIKVFVNCDEVLHVDIPAEDRDEIIKYDGTLDIPVPFEPDSYIVVMAFGENVLPKGMPQFNPYRVARFVTNAIFLDTDATGAYDNPRGYGKNCFYQFP